MTAIPHAATILEAMIARDLIDDLLLDSTHGGYRPTVRVMLQRHWSAELARIPELGRRVRPDVWVETSIGYADVGFADNRDAATYDRDARALGAVLKAAGFQVRHGRSNGLIVSTRVRTHRVHDTAVEAVAPVYLERFDRARVTWAAASPREDA